eukprot:gene2304-4478_t
MAFVQIRIPFLQKFRLFEGPSIDDIITENQDKTDTSLNKAVVTVNNPIEITPLFKKKGIAAISSILGAFLFVFQHSQPVSGAALLNAMAKDSTNLETALCNGKPTIIDFYAEWCESCKAMAPIMRQMEAKYGDKINFVMVDGTDANNMDLVGKFRVDGIPHFAFITKDAEVKTALIGAIPQPIFDDEIDSLAKGKVLPYDGYDAFEGESHFPFASSSSICSKRTNFARVFESKIRHETTTYATYVQSLSQVPLPQPRLASPPFLAHNEDFPNQN